MVVTDFEKVLFESIDESLMQLGELCRKATYYYLKKGFEIKKHEIPTKIDKFSAALEEIFGSGAKILEIQIMSLLNNKIGYTAKHDYKQDYLKFNEYIEAVRKTFINKPVTD